MVSYTTSLSSNDIILMTDILDELVTFLGGKCFLCLKPYPDKNTWTIHHETYKIGEKDYKDFKEKISHTITRGKRKGKKSIRIIYHKQEYYEYLKPIVFKEPHRFVPLHNSCHQALTRLGRWRKDNRQRLCNLAMKLP